MARMARKRLTWVALASAAVVGIATAALPALASADPGSIVGHLTNDGEPITDAYVSLVDGDYNYIASTTTDGFGGYQFHELAEGSYKLQYQLSSGFTQWAVQKRSFETAEFIAVTGGATTTVDEALRPLGSISGHVTDADGSPAEWSYIQASLISGEVGGGFVQADGEGFYTLNYLDPGDYRVSFRKDFNSPEQFAHNATSYDLATPIPVSVGAVTTLDQTLLATGILKGKITDKGVPVADVQLSIDQVDGDGYGFAYTGPDGNYELALLPGLYTVQVSRPDGLTQYAPRQLDYRQAGQYAVTAGATTILHEKLRATGIIAGRLTLPNGEPAAGAEVLSKGRASEQYAITDQDGNYQFKVYPGDHYVRYHTSYGTQWENGRATGDQADPITVLADSTVTADETLAAFGALSVTAVDESTGAPVASFCMDVQFASRCTDSGEVSLDEILPGRYTVYSYPQGNDTHVHTSVPATVTSGSTTAVVLSIVQGGVVGTIMTDAKTGSPVAGACLELVNVELPSSLGGNGPQFCSDTSGEVTVPQVRPGSYKAFVWANDGVHGHQWVGPDGGVGKFKRAVTVSVSAGQSITLPPIKLDKAGRITGTVTNELTGQPIRYATVSLSSYSNGLGAGGPAASTDSLGRYTLGGLGPYGWTLFFTAGQYASEWSGDSAYRDRAAGIKVRPGADAVYDTALGTGTVVTGRVTDPNGIRATDGRITLYNADSGDEIQVGDVYLSRGRYVTYVKGPQRVKLGYYATVGAQYYAGVVGGTDLSNAQVFRVPSGGQTRLNVTVTQTWP